MPRCELDVGHRGGRMRITSSRERLTLLTGNGGVDVETASLGRFAANPQAVFDHWPAFCDWARGATGAAGEAVVEGALGPPAPRPTQVFGIGLNYRDRRRIRPAATRSAGDVHQVPHLHHWS